MEKLQVFGKTAALTIECARRKRDGDNRAVEHGLTVEAANVLSGQQRRYNWENKLGFLVLDHELPLLACTLLGWQRECALRYHGPQRDKNLVVIHQGDSLLVELTATGASYRVKVGPTETFNWAMLALRQLQRTHAGISSDAILQTLKATAGRMLAAESRPRHNNDHIEQ